ncbi:MAG: hypothetical protein ACR2HX_03025 [Pyrinomonadaceae bacterium]
MKSRQHIVVSAENNPYLAWQCKLFHYSCVSRLQQTPLFVVHERDRDWRPDFKEIVNSGGRVRAAPSYLTTKPCYSPRNTAGTLLQAATIGYNRNDFIVLCDPDMLFVRKAPFLKRLAAEHYSYLDCRAEVREAARKLCISDVLLQQRKREVSCGVPYVVPVAQARELGEAWLEAIDSFEPGLLEISMYSFGLAVMKLGLKLVLTGLVVTNYKDLDAVKSADIIHYCYGNDVWNKRHYYSSPMSSKVWLPPTKTRSGTVLGEIVSQLHEAGEFYSKQQVASLG